MTTITKCNLYQLLFCTMLVWASPMISWSAPSTAASKQPATADSHQADLRPTSSISLEVLSSRIDQAETINAKLLQSIYWTLGTFATIFTALFSVNLYFNISANKFEIKKIREDITNQAKGLITSAEISIADRITTATQKEMDRVKDELMAMTNSVIKNSESAITDKITTANLREIEKAKETNLTALKNDLLTYQAKMTSLYETSEKNSASFKTSIADHDTKIVDLSILIKELEAFKFAQEGTMGAFYRHLELLEHDLQKRRWRLKFRLQALKKELDSTSIDQVRAKKLRELLKLVTEENLQDAVKEVEAAITVADPKPTPN